MQVVKRILDEQENEKAMSEEERADRLEGMVNRMAERLSEYVLATTQMEQLCWEIEKLPASEQQTKISVIASKIYQRMKAAHHG